MKSLNDFCSFFENGKYPFAFAGAKRGRKSGINFDFAKRRGGRRAFLEPVKSGGSLERMLKVFGAKAETDGNAVRIYPAQKLEARNMSVPGDLSSAAFFTAAALIVPVSAKLFKTAELCGCRTDHCPIAGICFFCGIFSLLFVLYICIKKKTLDRPVFADAEICADGF